jgi:hypothetical protein
MLYFVAVQIKIIYDLGKDLWTLNPVCAGKGRPFFSSCFTYSQPARGYIRGYMKHFSKTKGLALIG